VTDLGDLTRAVEAVIRDAGHLDIVIANARFDARSATSGRPSPRRSIASST
jgi:NAD(P)-dependent dehydrogenase (short-subunit alcohol dehydrogenase family)